MANHYVFRMQGTQDQGMRISELLYSAIVDTTEFHAEEKFPYLLARNSLNDRAIMRGKVRGFKQDIENAGKIILAHPLLEYLSKDTFVLAKRVSNHEAAVHLATLLELCDICIGGKKGINIKIEDGNPSHYALSLRAKLTERLLAWDYPASAKTLADYTG
ncbi:MAG: hypothetical protein Q8N63_08250 [Nanoarchaeota archaeon]|nr:hypothetical protein [Nanoarchaeota archaeon]